MVDLQAAWPVVPAAGLGFLLWGKASWGGVVSSPVNAGLTCCLASAIPGGSEITFPYFPHCDHCHFGPVRTPGFTSSALNVHRGAGGSFGGTGGGCNNL